MRAVRIAVHQAAMRNVAMGSSVFDTSVPTWVEDNQAFAAAITADSGAGFEEGSKTDCDGSGGPLHEYPQEEGVAARGMNW